LNFMEIGRRNTHSSTTSHNPYMKIVPRLFLSAPK
jgi:hypothetical protein